MRHNPATICGGKANAKPPKPPKSKSFSKRISKTKYHCSGGPLDGKSLYLESKATLVMNFGGVVGRYVAGQWEATV